MIDGILTVEFILLCGVQAFTIAFSAITFIHSLKRYLNTDKSEILLRKSIKYFTFIFITIMCAGVFSLVANFYFIYTLDGVVAGFIYTGGTTTILLNIFCAWQFLTYLIHPERRRTKYIIGGYCIIGIIITWFFTPIMNSVVYTPYPTNLILFIYIWVVFTFVWIVFAYDFLKHSVNATDKKEKYRFLCMGLCGIWALLLFPMGIIGQLFSWLVILSSTLLLYLGYNFPEFFRRRIES